MKGKAENEKWPTWVFITWPFVPHSLCHGVAPQRQRQKQNKGPETSEREIYCYLIICDILEHEFCNNLLLFIQLWYLPLQRIFLQLLWMVRPVVRMSQEVRAVNKNATGRLHLLYFAQRTHDIRKMQG